MTHIPSDQPKRENTFGHSCAQMRKRMGLTQSALRRRLGVSEQTIWRWEHGVHFPAREHLERLLALGLQHHAFAPGREYQEAQQLWQAAEQQADFDSFWIRMQLAAPSAHHTRLLLKKQKVSQVAETKANQEPAATSSHFDWGDALEVHDFYGREAERLQLVQWVVEERCQVVSVLGLGGIGKSALVIRLMHQIAPDFQHVIFRSLRDAPQCQDLLADCLQIISHQPLPALPDSVEESINLLLAHFQALRCLLILDNLESLLQEHDLEGRFRPGYEDYAVLLRRVAQVPHQSSLLLTSRESPTELGLLESQGASVRALRLAGLEPEACEQLFEERNLVGSRQDQLHLTQLYTGNPLALKIVAHTISELFAGEISQFLQEDTVVYGNIAVLLNEQFSRASALEQIILHWLAIMREPVILEELLAMLVPPISAVQVSEALEALRRHSLVEQDKVGTAGDVQTTYTLQSVMLEYMTQILVERVSEQIRHAVWEYLISYTLEQARVRNDVRQAQERLIVAPVLSRLSALYQGKEVVEEQLLQLLDQLRAWDQKEQGYGPANLIVLLRAFRGNLRSLDLSRLSIREAYLQGVEMQDTTLSGTRFRDSVWTSAFDATWAVAISCNGSYCAAGSRRGEVRIWRISSNGRYWSVSSGQKEINLWHEGGYILHLAWQAHTDTIDRTLAFSPDERLLATGSRDGTIKLWEVESGALLWTGWHANLVKGLAFAPDGQRLVSCGDDATVRIWETKSGANVEKITVQGTVYSVAWSPDGTHLAIACFDGRIQIWELQETQSATYVQTLRGHTHRVLELAFAPDGIHLASASWDQTVRLWEVTSGRCLSTLKGHTDHPYTVAWSPDGRTVASSGFDNTIWLWDAEQGCNRMVLHGHTGPVYNIAFTPDGHLLLSGSEDQTLRVWDVESGHCIHISQSYAVALHDVTWSPDGAQLASTGSDSLVTIWNVTEAMPSKVLRSHSRAVCGGMAWSQDGQRLASSGGNNAIWLWDSTMGTSVQVLQDPDSSDTIFYSMEWSPDGKFLASGSYMHGVQVWDMIARSRLWTGRAQQSIVRCVAWSHDSAYLASCGDDGTICVWQATDGTKLQVLQGHSTNVTAMAWSPDGAWLASGGGGRSTGELFLWNTSNGKHVLTFEGPSYSVSALAWNKPGDRLVSGSSDGSLRWWEVQSGKCLVVRQGHQGTIHALKISPNGQTLASRGDDGAIKLWNLESTELVRTLQRDRPYERLNITKTQGLSPAQKATLLALGAFEEDGDAS